MTDADCIYQNYIELNHKKCHDTCIGKDPEQDAFHLNIYA